MVENALKVAIGISTYNGAERVDELLGSLMKHTEPVDGGYKIYVLDDGGKLSNFERLKEVCGNYGVEVGRHDENLGISNTWNDLTRYFDSKYMVLLNDDLVLVDGWLESLLYFAENNKFATAGLPMYVPKKTGKPHSGWRKMAHGWKPFLAFPKTRPKRVPAAPGCCFIFKRTLFDFIGGFDEQYLSFYEEVDFSLSLADLGYASYILPYPWIYHYWARSFAENPELGANERMHMSEGKFVSKWGGLLIVAYPLRSVNIPRQKIKWLFNGERKTRLEDPLKKFITEIEDWKPSL